MHKIKLPYARYNNHTDVISSTCTLVTCIVCMCSLDIDFKDVDENIFGTVTVLIAT